MRSIRLVEGSPSLSQKWRSWSYTPLVRTTVGGDSDDVDAVLARHQNNVRRSFSYHRLPQQLLKLSVLKLDGSCFEVQIARMDSVSQLKLAVEEVFSRSPKEGEGEISWSHVWGHFCLCYEGIKLINDKESLQTLGIKDGDQLHFVRHLSINFNPVNRHSKYQRSASKNSHSVCPRALDIHEENKGNCKGGKEDDNNKEEDKYHLHHSSGHKKDAIIGHVDFKLALKRWFSCSKLGCMRRSRDSLLLQGLDRIA